MIDTCDGLLALRFRSLMISWAEASRDAGQVAAQRYAATAEGFADAEVAAELALIAAEYRGAWPGVLRTAAGRVLGRFRPEEVDNA